MPTAHKSAPAYDKEWTQSSQLKVAPLKTIHVRFHTTWWGIILTEFGGHELQTLSPRPLFRYELSRNPQRTASNSNNIKMGKYER